MGAALILLSHLSRCSEGSGSLGCLQGQELCDENFHPVIISVNTEYKWMSYRKRQVLNELRKPSDWDM